MLCEVDRSYIEDGFNLYGLRHHFENFQGCLDIILDRTVADDPQDPVVAQSAFMLYGMIHARFIVTARGLEAMYKKYRLAEFGRCPRTMCKNQPVVPVGIFDEPKKEAVKLYCPRCGDVYNTVSPYGGEPLDGAFFGTSFAHLFFITFDRLVPDPATETYTPLIFGFKIHKTAKCMQRRLPHAASPTPQHTLGNGGGGGGGGTAAAAAATNSSASSSAPAHLRRSQAARAGSSGKGSAPNAPAELPSAAGAQSGAAASGSGGGGAGWRGDLNSLGRGGAGWADGASGAGAGGGAGGGGASGEASGGGRGGVLWSAGGGGAGAGEGSGGSAVLSGKDGREGGGGGGENEKGSSTRIKKSRGKKGDGGGGGGRSAGGEGSSGRSSGRSGKDRRRGKEAAGERSGEGAGYSRTNKSRKQADLSKGKSAEGSQGSATPPRSAGDAGTSMTNGSDGRGVARTKSSGSGGNASGGGGRSGDKAASDPSRPQQGLPNQQPSAPSLHSQPIRAGSRRDGYGSVQNGSDDRLATSASVSWQQRDRGEAAGSQGEQQQHQRRPAVNAHANVNAQGRGGGGLESYGQNRGAAVGRGASSARPVGERGRADGGGLATLAAAATISDGAGGKVGVRRDISAGTTSTYPIINNSSSGSRPQSGNNGMSRESGGGPRGAERSSAGGSLHAGNNGGTVDDTERRVEGRSSARGASGGEARYGTGVAPLGVDDAVGGENASGRDPKRMRVA